MDYEEEARVLVESIVASTGDIYEYITNQIEGFYTKKEEHNGKEMTPKRLSIILALYKSENCRGKISIIGWYMKHFDTSFSCAVQSINQYYGFGLLMGLSKTEVRKIMKYAEEYYNRTFVEYE